ncbi:RHS repeat-associated core domain-containing protein [Chryseobacterium candidae]|uniref:RHS repeat-associated core domain-containing protein n=1 Tax=Chryseobacterium candidae TaxID=1978493 RepID=A0ABY2R8Y2_9FLAO|nr:RHS repeat-associated core domain-containing protein [Chryseobacterium candidae]THV62048.1 hypothetical protein EK417_06450 [Chryseobacterium candidae]
MYQYRDHLGNARVSFSKNSEGVLEVTDTNNYYPFGLNHIEGMLSSSNFGGYYSYKYQSQELQETGFYSFKWRNYMPDVGRFFNIDPLSEKYAYQSHYNFSENRVVNARELEGLEAVPINGNECDIQWKVKINNNLGADYSKTLLSDTSKILSQNGVTINVVEDANATFTVNLENPKVDLKNMQLINGESAMDGDTYGGAVTSKDSPRTLAHELGHKAGQDHIFDDTSKVPNTAENKDNLMNSGGNTNESLQSTTGTKLQEVQSNDMKSHINTVYQNTQKIINNEKNNNKTN